MPMQFVTALPPAGAQAIDTTGETRPNHRRHFGLTLVTAERV
jgi:hypothetical protein